VGDRPTQHPSLESQEEIKESLEIGLRRRGDPLDGFVTFRDLTDSQFAIIGFDGGRAVIRPGPGPGGPGGDTDIPQGPPDFGQNDPTRPPAPTGVRARGMNLDAIGVTWNPPPYNNHAYSEVFASFDNSWAAIAETFNANRPIGPGNQTQFFMGRSSGTTFLHRNLGSTVPNLVVQFEIIDFAYEGDDFRVRIDGNQTDSMGSGDEAYFAVNADWPGNGVQGEIINVSHNAGQGWTEIIIEGTPGLSSPPAGASLNVVRDLDDLEQALNPSPIYYWVRFVSTANVSGPTQGEEGAEGTVMVNPEEVLNILTGRIRASQLASDIVSPINFIRGPITEVDEEGNRLYPTVRDFVLAQGDAILTEYDEILEQVFLGNIAPEDSPWEGVAAAATLVQSIEGAVEDNSAYIQFLQTLQAAIYSDDGDLLDLEGIHQIVGTIQEKSVVNLGLEDAAVAIWNNLQLELEDENGDPVTIVANEAAQKILVNEGAINNSITFKAQINSGGVLYSAGFGVGLEQQPGEDPVSTFAVAADQFAIMSAASHGRVITQIQSSGSNWTVTATNLAASGVDDGLEIGKHVAFTVPFGSPIDEFRGKRFEVISRPPTTPPNDFAITVKHVPLNEEDEAPSFIGSTSLEAGHALFPEQSIPFIVNTTVDPPVVGIRGSLVVDGMITATEIEVVELLRANEIWSNGITSFGLINTASLIGEVIATPRFGGWAVKMTSPDTSYQNRILEYSRWSNIDDALPDPDEDDLMNQPDMYPQLRGDQPTDTAFFVDAQGRAFVRGSFQVGGNARILTYNDQGSVPGDHFVQMDHMFPLMVFPQSQVGVPGMETDWWVSWNYTDAVQNHVREHALFWVHRNGTAGFNTRPGGSDAQAAIFLGDTPMEAPVGGGTIGVITRLDNGAPTGNGRVQISASFEVRSNRFSPDDRIGIWYDLFLVPADMDLGGEPMTVAMTQRESQIQNPNGDTHPYQLGSTADFMDAHFLIIRATSAGSVGVQPGWDARDSFMNIFQLHSRWVRGFYSASAGPRAERIEGDIEVPQSLGYKAVVVATEISSRDGTGLGGALTTSGQAGSAIMMLNGRITAQQISTRRVLTDAEKNSWSDGSGGGGTPPNPGHPGDPVPPGHEVP